MKKETGFPRPWGLREQGASGSLRRHGQSDSGLGRAGRWARAEGWPVPCAHVEHANEGDARTPVALHLHVLQAGTPSGPGRWEPLGLPEAQGETPTGDRQLCPQRPCPEPGTHRATFLWGPEVQFKAAWISNWLKMSLWKVPRASEAPVTCGSPPLCRPACSQGQTYGGSERSGHPPTGTAPRRDWGSWAQARGPSC